MYRLLKLILVVALVAAVLTGGTLVWALESESDDFAFVPRAAQPTLPVVELEGQQPPPAGAGSVLFSTVGVRHASIFETWFGVGDGGELVPAHALVSPGESDADRSRLDSVAMGGSQETAEVVALRALGYAVVVKPAGVRIIGLSLDAPIRSDGAVLGDVIIAVDGKTIRTTDDLRQAVRAIGAGKSLAVTVHRDGKALRIATHTMTGTDGAVVLGIIPASASIVETPRAVTYSVEGVGGPSAGLAFALEIYSAGKAYANLGGLRVAATGTLAIDGSVGPIGGVAQKTIGAARANADLFLVPSDNAEEARAAAPPGVTIVPVGSFSDAVKAITAATAKRLENAQYAGNLS